MRRRGYPARLAALVAHHSGARFVAAVRGLAGELSQFPYEDSAVSGALTYADQTTSPHGDCLPIEERIAESLDRHGPDSAQARARSDRVRSGVRIHVKPATAR